MTQVFLIFFVLYLLYALWENLIRRATDGKRLSLASMALQAPLFLSAGVLSVQAGVLNRDLVFLPMILLALVAGHVCFGVSLLVTNPNPRDAFDHCLHVRPIARYLADDPMTLFRVFGVSFTEEIIYRVVAQPMLAAALGNTVAGILLAAAAFCVVHQHFFRNPWPQSLEFAAFAVLLGALYWWTGSLVLVVLIHAVRNWEIAYLEYVLAQQDGDTATAATPQPGTP